MTGIKILVHRNCMAVLRGPSYYVICTIRTHFTSYHREAFVQPHALF